jgi:hypothetical protein
MAHTDNHAKDSAANTLKNNIIDSPSRKGITFLWNQLRAIFPGCNNQLMSWLI